ncbi:hypothetical protein PVAP13_5NG371981 [Panicum virgatum]|uniref:Uncharacterized protein n=1 Tax=Panicum virgatum TaxID=38727 RepID=A0A8T0RT01_PANVG|nr:hypothetical protein PVAP13_5NG371981 [Panicum virgatum]
MAYRPPRPAYRRFRPAYRCARPVRSGPGPAKRFYRPASRANRAVGRRSPPVGLPGAAWREREAEMGWGRRSEASGGCGALCSRAPASPCAALGPTAAAPRPSRISAPPPRDGPPPAELTERRAAAAELEGGGRGGRAGSRARRSDEEGRGGRTTRSTNSRPPRHGRRRRWPPLREGRSAEPRADPAAAAVDPSDPAGRERRLGLVPPAALLTSPSSPLLGEAGRARALEAAAAAWGGREAATSKGWLWRPRARPVCLSPSIPPPSRGPKDGRAGEEGRRTGVAGLGRRSREERGVGDGAGRVGAESLR